jgi:hypothetical protein
LRIAGSVRDSRGGCADDARDRDEPQHGAIAPRRGSTDDEHPSRWQRRRRKSGPPAFSFAARRQERADRFHELGVDERELEADKGCGGRVDPHTSAL